MARKLSQLSGFSARREGGNSSPGMIGPIRWTVEHGRTCGHGNDCSYGPLEPKSSQRIKWRWHNSLHKEPFHILSPFHTLAENPQKKRRVFRWQHRSHKGTWWNMPPSWYIWKLVIGFPRLGVLLALSEQALNFTSSRVPSTKAACKRQPCCQHCFLDSFLLEDGATHRSGCFLYSMLAQAFGMSLR